MAETTSIKKRLIPSKMIISFDVNGDFDNGLLLYKISTDGIIGKEQKSISIKNMEFSKLHLAKIIEIVIAKTKEQEGADNG